MLACGTAGTGRDTPMDTLPVGAWPVAQLGAAMVATAAVGEVATAGVLVLCANTGATAAVAGDEAAVEVGWAGG